MNRRCSTIVCVVLLGIVACGASSAATVYVDASQTGFGDGTLANPFRRIQAGLDNAAVGDVVFVAAGEYFESLLMADGVALQGEDRATTIINASGAENSAVTFSGTPNNPSIRGFTIKGGSGDFIGTQGNNPLFIGGGVSIINSSAIVEDCIITENSMTEGLPRGGGIYINVTLGDPRIVGNLITGNLALSSTVAGRGEGGAIYANTKSGTLSITDNVIEFNQAGTGGGIYSETPGTATINIMRNVIQFNEADEGAAIFSRDDNFTDTLIVNNLIAVNSSSGPGLIDCEDTNGARSPGLTEVCGDGIDNDCNGATQDLFDFDGDGDDCSVDCADDDPTLGPGTAENCKDQIDNDCDGAIDFFNPGNLVLVEFGASTTYLANSVDPLLGLTWVAPGFDDSAWSAGNFGIGYETGVGGAENLLVTDLTGLSPLPASVYTRTTFEIEDPNQVVGLFLGADYDDGYAAWINGEEVYRSPEMPPTGDPSWDADPAAHESSNGSVPDYGTLNDISIEIEHLVAGTNLLAIGIYADVPGATTDLVLVPKLSIAYGTEDADCLCEDLDDDGYAGGICNVDCLDSDPLVSPAAAEICGDGIDNDCDGLADDTEDFDGDGFDCAIDCDDGNAAVNPGVIEIYCDDLDNDCNPLTEDVVDNDGDFFFCDVDCNDSNPAINPNIAEFCFDGIDNNCDGFVDDADTECRCDAPVDSDGDGYRCRDCNDGNAAVNPGANEIGCDGLDNDCQPATADIFDGDGDGFACDLDCNDVDPTINTAAIEICNDLIDNDCDTLVDNDDPDCTGCPDDDLDGYPAGSCAVDCDDTDANVNPAATEICDDTIDNDCDPATPDIGDLDGDTFDCLTDCNDANAQIFPGAAEQCSDGVDNDCDGLIDVFDPDLVLVKFGSPMRYLANLSDPAIGLAWIERLYDDSPWSNGLYGVGYQVLGIPGPTADDLLLSEVVEGARSVYSRAPFIIPDLTGVDALFLGADYDDAYAVWINGTEVYRSPEVPAAPAPLDWDTVVGQHESSNGTTPDYGTLIDISAAIGTLVEGDNVLAVAVWNLVPAGGGISSDLVLVPRLSMSYGDDDEDCVGCVDLDGDGYAGGACAVDCDDDDAQINPGAAEIGCDTLDNDCDPATSDLIDGDADGDLCNVDCNDLDPTIGPSQSEIFCDFLDNNCNGSADEITDQDNDGFDCVVDCNDNDRDVNPTAVEIGCDFIDNDCDSLTADNLDQDRDGFFCIDDCDDADPLINPSVPEHCNDNTDNDCDGLTDADPGVEDPDCFNCVAPDDDIDDDGDGYICNDCDDTTAQRSPALAETCNDGLDNDCDDATPDVADLDGDGFDCWNVDPALIDCDDTNPFTSPAGLEFCNDGVDNDCDPATPDIFDGDGDGFPCFGGPPNPPTDCNDVVAEINPDAEEVCADGVDNDCDPATLDLVDGDNDGWFCGLDCADDDINVFPGAAEVCNDMIDNDCNPLTADIFDADGDGASCDVDCDDSDPSAYPGNIEQCVDNVDNDCDTLVDGADDDCTSCVDSDTDDYACGDCDDGDPLVNPGATEICGNMIDEDCDGLADDSEDLDGDGFDCSVDCDDTKAGVNPGATEVECDLLDNDCNPATSDVTDGDADGFDCWNVDPALIDCDDGNPNVNPGQVELGCDGADNDCDPATPDLADADGDQFSCADPKIRGAGISSLVFGSGAVTIVNNTITNNKTLPLGIGGGIYLDDIMSGGSSLVVNNIVSNNDAFLGGGVDHTAFFGEIRNNALYNNSAGDLYNGAASGAVLSSNLFVNPEFVSPFALNFRLKASSPLVDAADPGAAPQNDLDRVERPFDGDGDLLALPDIGAFEYPSAEVFGLRFISRDEITWDVRPGEEKFNLYRGTLRQLLLNGLYTQGPAVPQAAQFCGVTPAMLPFVDATVPSNRTYFYLVTLTTPSYEGSLGQDSFGALRPNDSPCP